MAMDEEYLYCIHSERSDDTDGIVEVRPSVWLMSPDVLPPCLLTVSQAAKCMALDEPEVGALVDAGRLRTVSVGRERRVSLLELGAFVAALSPDGEAASS